MANQIRPNRQDVNDRFPMLGFTIRTDGGNKRYEVAIASDVSLFRPDARARRARANFYSSRAFGLQPIRSGEAVYVLPPDILARFVGQEKLYYALVTYSDDSNGSPEITAIPSEASAYVSLNGLTGRSLRRVRVLPSRQRVAAGYGNGGGSELEWGGDVSMPGTQAVPTVPEQTPRNGQPGNGRAAAPGQAPQTSSPAPIDYKDGFGPLPAPNGATPALGYTPMRPGERSQTAVRPLEVVELDYSPSNTADALRMQLDFQGRYSQWLAGVRDTNFFPHSAICKIVADDGSFGTGCYIGPSHILTAAHVVEGANSLTIIPGKNGGADLNGPFGSVAASGWNVHPQRSSGSHDFDLAVISVPTPPPNGEYFPILEELRQSLPSAIIVCGYAAQSDQHPDVTATIDPERQHLDGDQIRTVADQTFQYNLQTLHGTSGAPVYYVWGREDEQRQMSVVELHLVGVHVSGGSSTLNTGCRLTDDKISWIRSVMGLSATAAGMSVTSALGYDVGLIPQPNKLACWAASMAMLVGYRRGVSITPESLAQEVDRSLRTSYGWDMLEAVKDHFGFQDISLPSNASLYYEPAQWQEWLNQYGPLWVTTIGAPSHAIVVTGLDGDMTSAGTTVSILNPWDTTQNFSADEVDFDPFNPGRAYTQTFADFAADFGNLGLGEYGNWRVLHLPAAQGSQGLAYQDTRLRRVVVPTRTTTARTLTARAQTNECYSLNWDEVEVIAQPTEVSCWAAAAAMVIGWRDRVCLTPDTVANISRRTTATGLDPAQVQQFANEMNLTFENPQCYSVEGFRQLLESSGPLWIAADVPGLHAIVVTGMYSDGAPDGSDTYVRITDPWDRNAGTPGAPGAYLPTHNTGSRYILRWQDFLTEYEGATRFPTVNLQILHSTNTDGRQPSRSGAVGYAMEAGAEGNIASSEDDGGGIDEGIPTSDEEAATAQSFTSALEEPPEYPQASRFAAAASVNYRTSTSPRTISRIVIHITDGGSRISGTVGWFQNPNQRNSRGNPIHVSAHYVVGQDGEVVQMVHHNDVAWHANSANRDSIGIEHVANTRGLMPTDAQYCGSAALVRWLCDTYSIPIDRTHILGHSEADTRTTHTSCPNAVWDWDHFMDLVQTASCKARAQARAQAAALSESCPTDRLPRPPVPVRGARALEASTTEITSVIPGTVMERVIGREGNITWQLDQLRGLKHPNNTAPNPASLLRDASTIRLDSWPYLDTGQGNILSAWFSVDWQFNGQSVGNVRIVNTGTSATASSGLGVEARLIDDPVVYPSSNPTYAALLVMFTYRFKAPDGSDLIAKTNLHLLGDGTFDKNSVWERV